MKRIARSYTALRNDIARVLKEGRGRAERAVEQERLRSYYEIGRLLDEFQQVASYGDGTIAQLAGDTGLSKSLLYQTLAFYRFNPKFHTWKIRLGALSDPAHPQGTRTEEIL
jgi:hypothetical protein